MLTRYHLVQVSYNYFLFSVLIISLCLQIMAHLWRLGYACEDIIGTVFRGAKQLKVSEELLLEFVKEIGLTHMRIVDGSNSLLQMSGLLARLCLVATSKTY